MRNAEIADAMAELATLYELDGAIRYRVLAYREAARVIRQSPVSVEELALAGKATELPGIGETLQTKIVALVETGEIPSATKLKAKYPASLVEVTRIPGLGAKTVRRLYDELGVATLDDLRAAAEGQRIRDLKGLGPKVEENVIAALATLGEKGPAERLLLSQALPVAEELAAALRAHPASDAVTVAGSARRRAETCKDIDLIATARDPKQLAIALTEHELVAQAGSAGASGTRVTTYNGLSVDLRIVEPEAYGNLLQHFTGSAKHNVELRERALRDGLSVSEHGITDEESGEVARYRTEAEVYARLGLAYIEPELREGGGEIAAAAADELPELVELADIRGDLHCHTTLSDGRNTLEEMAEAARARGYTYLAVTDHSASHGFGNHVTADALRGRIEEVAAFNAASKRRFRLLAGSEVNIGTDGSLDYDGRPARRARLGDRERPHLVSDLAKGDDQAGGRGDREPARRLHRSPDRAPDRQARALRDRRRGGRRGGGGQPHPARDQRQPQPPRPLRAPRPARRRGRGGDLRQHRRPRRRHALQHRLRGRHGSAWVADPQGRSRTPEAGASCSSCAVAQIVVC